MEQNSEDWLKFRGNSIGASEIPIIMDASPYKKRATLLREKAFPFPKNEDGQSDDKKFIFAKGHNYEKKIRNFVEFSLDLDLSHTPTVVFEAEGYDTPIHASLDGITPDGQIIGEFKFVGFEAFLEYKKTKKPPHNYFLQIQQQLLITKAKKCIFGMCREVPILDSNKKKIGVDLEYDYFDVFPCRDTHENILICAAAFWIEVKQLRAKGPSKEKDYSHVDELIDQYEVNIAALDLIGASQEVLKKKIFEIVGSEKLERETYTVQTVISKGATKKNYDAYFKDNKLTLPVKYITTGKGSSSQRITIKKLEEKEE